MALFNVFVELIGMFLEAGWQHRIIRCALRVRQIKLLDRFLAFGSDFSLLLRLGVVFRFSRFISIIICAVDQFRLLTPNSILDRFRRPRCTSATGSDSLQT